MSKKGQGKVSDRRSGGVYIGGSARVQVTGDVVGRDKISFNEHNEELVSLFKRLEQVVEENKKLSPSERQEILFKSQELQQELTSPEPDLGKVSKIKQFLVSKGEWLAGAVSPIFLYPPVQETIKTLAQRLIGS